MKYILGEYINFIIVLFFPKLFHFYLNNDKINIIITYFNIFNFIFVFIKKILIIMLYDKIFKYILNKRLFLGG